MHDLISRAAVVDAIDGVDWYHINKNGEMVHGANDNDHQAWYKAEDIYKAVGSVPSAQQWVPCKIRKPKKDGEYFVTYRGCEGLAVALDYYHVNVDEWEAIGLVIAWMPKPEPWKGERDG